MIRIVDVVFARKDPHAWRRVGMSWAAAGVLAVASAVAIRFAQGSACECGIRPPLRVDRTLTVEDPPAPTAVAPPKNVEPPPSPPDTAQPAAQSPNARPAPPTFAQAGAILAREPSANDPVDLTGQAFVTGTGPVFGGGLTTTSGSSTAAVRTAPTPTQSGPARTASRLSSALSRARTVGLPEPSWTCPWPAGAESELFDEQSAFVQVTVRPNGSVESALVLRDPGYGFGDAALHCALSARFSPALDTEGAPIRAVSPPIRVRFVR